MRVAWPTILCCWLVYFSWYVPLDRSSVAAEECSVSSVMVEGLSGEVRTSPSPSSPGGAVGLKYFLPQTFFFLKLFFCFKHFFASNFFASKFFGLKHEKMSQKFSPSVSVSTDLKTSQGSPKLSRLSEDEWSQIFDNQFVSNWTSNRC